MRILVLQCPLSIRFGGNSLGLSRLPQLLWIFASFARSASADFSAFAALITSTHVKSSSDDEVLILSRRRALYVQPEPSSSQRKFLPAQSPQICEENNTQSLDEQAALNVNCICEFSSHGVLTLAGGHP